MSDSSSPTSPSETILPFTTQPGKSLWLDLLETVAIIIGIFLLIHQFVAQPHLVQGDSMMPTYQNGEYILTDQEYSWGERPQRGDVIVLKSPDDKSIQFIKRIIGLPGEKIKISNNQVIIYNSPHPNGFTLHETYLGSATTTTGGTFIPDGETISIPAGKYVVMGDNRNYSYDSRTWGFLDRKDIVGKAFFVYWPIAEIGFTGHAKYQ